MRTAAAALVLAILLVAWVMPRHTGDAHAQRKRDLGGPPGKCAIDSVTPVAFGGYDTDATAPLTTTGRLRFNCKPPTETFTVKVTIGPSTVSGSINDRQMREAGGGNVLHYNLFQDVRGTIIWGDGTNGGNAAFIRGAGEFDAEIYGVMPARQEVAEGVYADSVRITIAP